MKICFDLQSAIGQRTGVGNYTAHLAEALIRSDPSLPIRFFYFDFQRRGHALRIPVDHETAVRWCPGRFVQKAWKILDFPPFEWMAGRADVYHFPNFIIPPLRSGKAVVTIHDLAFRRMPETIEPKNLLYLSGQMERTLRRADAVITVSRFTAAELQELYAIPADRVFPVHEALCETPEPPADAAERVRRRFPVKRPYLLTVGTVEPRKNYTFLMDVFDALEDDLDLVIAGGLGWRYEPIQERLRRSPKADRIHITGYLTRDELAALYAAADLFVYPTRYEGFGFPPLEAMRYRLPVLASSIPPLLEILGDAAAWAPLNDLDAWCHAIPALLRDTDRQKRLVEAGTRQVARYSWADTASRTLDVYRKAVAS